MDNLKPDFQKNTKKKEGNPPIQEDLVLIKTVEILFQRGFINLKEKKRLNELIKKNKEAI